MGVLAGGPDRVLRELKEVRRLVLADERLAADLSEIGEHAGASMRRGFALRGRFVMDLARWQQGASGYAATSRFWGGVHPML